MSVCADTARNLPIVQSSCVVVLNRHWSVCFERLNKVSLAMYRFVIIAALFSTFTAPAVARELVFKGEWRTTNRPLNGVMTCKATDLGAEKWQGRFFGVWQGVPFDYTVNFSGPASELRGTATIDGAAYTWAGSMDRSGRLVGTFGGERYEGHFDLQRKRPVRAKPKQ